MREKVPEDELNWLSLNLSDLDVLVAQSQATSVEVETKRAIFDSLDDLDKNLHKRARLVKLVLKFPHDSELTLVPRVEASGTAAKAVKDDIVKLCRKRERPWPLWILSIALVAYAAWLIPIRILMRTNFHGRPIDYSKAGPIVVQFVLLPLLALLIGAFFMGRILGDVIVPERSQKTFVRKHLLSVTGAIILAIITAAAGSIVTYLLSEH